ncbi:outer membrane beta-barrel protein [Methylosarcina fibrata]|uniref:outer membrane beta-barrel protein n=1 Tax=Methylosarcina fibrata TaxID=105972 RepID=UPI00037D596B|nr:outer membrane beta-barrel protein [Methylosarcina fibrata]
MKPKIKVVLMLFAFVQALNVQARDKETYPGMIPIGPFDLVPYLGFKESYNDNIFHNDNNRKSSFVTQIQGGGELALRRKLDRYAVGYSILHSQYHSSPADNYDDHFLNANAHVEMTRRNRFDFNAGVTYGHYMRGTLFSQGDLATDLKEPDQFHEYTAEMKYRYGRVDAKGNLGLQFGWSQLEFDNHPERTAQWDRTRFEITPGFYFRVMPKTYLTSEVETSVIEYMNQPDNTQTNSSQFFGVDYVTRRYLLGMTWDQSSKTKGIFRAGYQQQEFTDSNLEGTNALTWDGKILWSPMTYSTFNFGMLRDIQPSIGAGYLRQVQVYRAGWKHEWPWRVTTQLNGSYQEAKNQGSAQKSNGVSFSLDAKYEMKPWLNLGMKYSYSDFQYDTNDANSTLNIFMFYITATPQAVAAD